MKLHVFTGIRHQCGIWHLYQLQPFFMSCHLKLSLHFSLFLVRSDDAYDTTLEFQKFLRQTALDMSGCFPSSPPKMCKFYLGRREQVNCPICGLGGKIVLTKLIFSVLKCTDAAFSRASLSYGR